MSTSQIRLTLARFRLIEISGFVSEIFFPSNPPGIVEIGPGVIAGSSGALGEWNFPNGGRELLAGAQPIQGVGSIIQISTLGERMQACVPEICYEFPNESQALG